MFGLALAAAATASATTTALAKRRTGRFVEEVDLPRVDRDRDVAVQLQLYVRRELGDDIRPRPDDALLVLGAGRELLVDRDRLRRERIVVDLEVRHRLGAER